MKATFDLNKLTYIELYDMMDALSKGEIETAYSFVAKIISSWESPMQINPESIMSLDVETSAALVREAIAFVNARMEAEYDYSLPVFLSKWNTRRFLDFNKALKERDIKKVAAMLPEVVQINQPISAADGINGVKAISSAYGRVIAAKN